MSDTPERHRPRLFPGVAGWTLFAVAALLLRGVRWDENYEFAQAMDRTFGYPEGHPLVVYVRSAYNVQFHVSGFAALITDNPAFLNGFRNLAFILATVLPPFLLGAILAGRVLAGHICVVFVLAGIHLEFDGAYPQFVWPGMFSNGHIGTGFALTTVALFMGGYLRTAALVLGLMPMIHLGHAPPLLILTSAIGALAIRRRAWTEIRIALPYLLAGLAYCAAFYYLQRMFAIPPPVDGPYAAQVPASEVWRGIVSFHDMHRQIPFGNSHLMPMLMAPVAVGGWRFLMRTNPAWKWTCLYAAIIVGIVYSTIAAQLILGDATPYTIIGWLPYRLANQLAIIAIALCVAVLLSHSDDRSGSTTWILPALLLFLVIRPLLGQVMAEATFYRYFAAADAVFFALIGAAAGRLCGARDEEQSLVGIIALIWGATMLVLAWFHQFGAACAAVGTVFGWILTQQFPRDYANQRAFSYSSSVIVIVFLLTTLAVQFQNRSHLPVGDFERDVSDFLEAQDNSRAMLVGPPYQLMLQAQTNHPVMSDMATHYHSSYMPSLAPSIQRMYQAVYGIDLTRPDNRQPGWRVAWSKRLLEEWRTLAEEFDLHYVIAPNELDIDLPTVIQGETNSLHRIPRGIPCQC